MKKSMQSPVVFDFTKKTVTQAGDPAVARAVREALEAQKAVKMTGPGVVAAASPKR
jgi:hypothetical protein